MGDTEAIAFGAGDDHVTARGRVGAARAPDAVSDLHPALAMLDGGDHDDALPDEARGPVVELGVAGRHRVALIISAPAKDSRHRQQSEQSKLEREGQADQGDDDAGDARGRRHPDQEDAWNEDLEDAEQSRREQPPPMRFEAVHVWPPNGSPPCGIGVATTSWGLLSASRASSPIPPSVPISGVASTGNRMVLAFGERANSPIASTYFWAMK